MRNLNLFTYHVSFRCTAHIRQSRVRRHGQDHSAHRAGYSRDRHARCTQKLALV